MYLHFFWSLPRVFPRHIKVNCHKMCFTLRCFRALRSSSLCAARGAFVLLDILSLGRCYPHTFSMEPPLTDVTSNPKLVCVVVPTTTPTERITVLILVLSITLFK